MRAQLNTARQVFEEALAAFALRTRLVGTERFDDLRAEEHYRAFAVAGAMKADLLADLHEAVRKAVVDGGTIQDFRRDFWDIVERRGWHGWTGEGTRHGEAWRTRVIYTTNTRKSFSTGRYAQLTDPAVTAVLPYWRWRHSGTARDPRPEHQAWDGMTLHHTHPFWQTHFPPRIPPDHGCGCRVEAVRGPSDDASTEPPAGWEATIEGGGVAPPADVVEDIRQMVRAKQAALPATLARDLGAAVSAYVIGSRATAATAGAPPAPPVTPVAAPAAATAAATAVPEAYQIAAAGGTHAGTLARYRNEGTIQLRKAIRSLTRRIAEHEQWIADPTIKLGDPYDATEARYLVESKWTKDVARLRAQRDLISGILQERGYGDEG